MQKSKLIERIAELLEQKKLPLLDDIHDESAEDIRIVLTPKSRTVEPEILMEQLFRASDLEARIPLNMNVLDKGLVPRVMSLKEVLTAFIDHRREVLERRSTHRLEKIKARLEVLEGYLAVFLNLDKVIKIIRTEDEPKPKLMKAFGLTEVQAEAILNMRLRSLRKLEEMEIRGEHADLTKEHKDLTRLLGSEKLKSEKLIEEMKAIDAKFGVKTELGKRRTEIARRPRCGGDVGAGRRMRSNCQPRWKKSPSPSSAPQKVWLRALKGHQEHQGRQISRRRPRPLLVPRPDHRPDHAAGDRWPLLHPGLQQAAGRARQWRGDPQLHRSAAGSRYRHHVRACAGPEAAARRQQRPWLHHQSKTTPSP